MTDINLIKKEENSKMSLKDRIKSIYENFDAFELTPTNTVIIMIVLPIITFVLGVWFDRAYQDFVRTFKLPF